MKTASPPLPFDSTSFKRALASLAAADPHLDGLLVRWGPPPFWTHPPGFPGLVHAILSQQVSLESAQAAFSKLEAALGRPTPQAFLGLRDPALRAIGFSRQKQAYVRGIASAIVTGDLDLDQLAELDDLQARERLLALRGVGPWTADTYLLFALRRPDVWPSGDLALEIALQELFELPARPASAEADRLAESWKPWRAAAARILWHAYLQQRSRASTQ